MTPEEKLSIRLAELQAVCNRQLDDIHKMVAGLVPCAPVAHVCGADAKLCCDEFYCPSCMNKHWLEEHSTGDAKRDCNFGISR